MTRGSQVARVQAVVCTVVSAQVFKEPDMHIDRRGEALVAHSYDLGCVRSYRFHGQDMWFDMLHRERGLHAVPMYTYIVWMYTLSSSFTAVWLLCCGDASLV